MPNAKQWFLTWPQCSVERESVVEQLRASFAADIVAYVVAQEAHADGSPHIHAYVRFDRKVNLNGNMHKFDIKDQNGELKHGNYQTARSAKHVIEYCKKDGNFISHNVEVDNSMAQAIMYAKEGKIDDAIELLWSDQPRMMLTRAIDIKKNLQTLYLPKWTKPNYNFSIGVDLKFWWMTQCFHKTLVLRGDAGTGKTSWARSLSEDHLFVTHLDDLRDLKPSHSLIIFDDVGFSHLPRTAIIHLTDLEHQRSVHVRYAVAKIPARLPRIILTNEYTVFGEHHEDQAIQRRCEFIDIGTYKLW